MSFRDTKNRPLDKRLDDFILNKQNLSQFRTNSYVNFLVKYRYPLIILIIFFSIALCWMTHSNNKEMGWTIISCSVCLIISCSIILILSHLKKKQDQFFIVAEQAIFERQRLELVVASSGAGILLLSNKFEYLWKNNQFNDWACKQLNDIVQKISSKALDEKIPQLIESCVINEEGRKYFFTLNASPIHDMKDNVDQVVVMVHDITYHKSVEVEMIRTSKLATLGHVSAGIAHEIGNPLSSLVSRLQLMESRTKDPFFLDSIDLLKRQVDRIGRTVRHIARISKPIISEFAMVPIKAVLDEVVGILQFDRRFQKIVISVDMDENLSDLYCNKDQLFQVFINIGLNAADAITKEGKLDIITFEKEGSIYIVFKDTGEGISEAQIPLLFRPFVTTKDHGTGLGLSISDGIVKAHSGKILVSSELGIGTTFTVILPVNKRAIIL